MNYFFFLATAFFAGAFFTGFFAAFLAAFFTAIVLPPRTFSLEGALLASPTPHIVLGQPMPQDFVVI